MCPKYGRLFLFCIQHAGTTHIAVMLQSSHLYIVILPRRHLIFAWNLPTRDCQWPAVYQSFSCLVCRCDCTSFFSWTAWRSGCLPWQNRSVSNLEVNLAAYFRCLKCSWPHLNRTRGAGVVRWHEPRYHIRVDINIPSSLTCSER